MTGVCSSDFDYGLNNVKICPLVNYYQEDYYWSYRLLAEPTKKSKTTVDTCLPFERRIVELEQQLNNITSDEDRQALTNELEREREAVFSNLSAWQRIQLARHPQRPRMLDYTSRILDDLLELHGDRALGDDAAMITGIGRFQGKTIMVVGQQKGITTDEKIRCNFGMASPHGYRKALRMFHMAERLKIPVVTFVDTPAADPNVSSEQYGQGPLIAKNLVEMSRLKTPILSLILGEGGSGGALAIAVADWVAMFEYAVYVICPPERCAEILWRDVEKKEIAAKALRVSAQELLSLGTIDTIMPEPGGGAHRNPDGAAQFLAEEIDRFLMGCKEDKWSAEQRQKKFARMGMWKDVIVE